MSNVYRNQKTGLITATGKIKEISEDRMVLTLSTEEYDRGQKKKAPVDFIVSTGVPFTEDYQIGYTATAVGYPRGKGVIAGESVLIGNDLYENMDYVVVSGLVKFARMNEEKNADGTPKVKQDGITPKKPHYDVTISVYEKDKWVDHIIKVYAGNPEEGKKSPVDRIAACFKNFDSKENRIRATFVTTPGQSYSYTVNKDGREYINNACSHIGFASFDVEYIDAEKQKTQAPAQTPVKAADAPAAQTPSTVNTQDGFTAADLSMDEDEMFK